MKLFGLFLALAAIPFAIAFELKVSDQDDYRQACSGMWAGANTFIKGGHSFSRGQIAMVIYEWRDVKYLGIDTEPDNYLVPKTYVCTTDAVRAKLCQENELGRFILNLKGAGLEDVSIWSASVAFKSSSNSTTPGANSTVSAGASGFWDNPDGPPTPPASEWDSPWKRQRTRADLETVAAHSNVKLLSRNVNNTVVPTSGTLQYSEPILYRVEHKGYYCIAATIPITTGATADTAVHASFNGIVLFHNVFHGKLAATDYPKINFYLALALVYVALGGLWAFMCFKHRDDLLPLQYYISYLVGFLVIEMIASWGTFLSLRTIYVAHYKA
ncbi:hypothetical protein FRC10_005773 [Ceratobasidium sp. 414]|nr:hypothetical protein FRC10_005773 [Ceratobasidium sp. 414]